VDTIETIAYSIDVMASSGNYVAYSKGLLPDSIIGTLTENGYCVAVDTAGKCHRITWDNIAA